MTQVFLKDVHNVTFHSFPVYLLDDFRSVGCIKRVLDIYHDEEAYSAVFIFGPIYFLHMYHNLSNGVHCGSFCSNTLFHEGFLFSRSRPIAFL